MRTNNIVDRRNSQRRVLRKMKTCDDTYLTKFKTSTNFKYFPTKWPFWNRFKIQAGEKRRRGRGLLRQIAFRCWRQSVSWRQLFRDSSSVFCLGRAKTWRGAGFAGVINQPSSDGENFRKFDWKPRRPTGIKCLRTMRSVIKKTSIWILLRREPNCD